MKLMSFGLTTSQILSETKFVTRRVGWRDLAHGDFVQAVEKAQGLKKGEKVKRLKTLEVLEIRARTALAHAKRAELWLERVRA